MGEECSYDLWVSLYDALPPAALFLLDVKHEELAGLRVV
jgi:hypothetical protein